VLTGRKVFGKLEQIERRYEALRYKKVADVHAEVWETTEYFRRIPEGVEWKSIEPGWTWGGDWITAWFRAEVKLPEQCDGRRVFVRANTDAETLFLVDGEPRGVFDKPNHPVVMMTSSGEAGKTYILGFEAYSGHTFPGTQPHEHSRSVTPGCRTFGGIEILLEREDVTRFVMDLKVLLSLVRALDENSLRRNVLMRELAKVFVTVPMMPGEVDESIWRPAIAQATEIMRPLLEKKNGPTVSLAGLVGHSHIDTAWLWTLAETRRKCARTFSSVLNLMEQYPEMTFIQSAPCHLEMIKDDYPGLFEQIKSRVAEGRWEPNGGMWVEPDCNITSGEAMVRQLLVAQMATREWFGYTSDTLWLPDVFGYSAALPQILRGAGVRFFCTTKIGWNDTTRFPYDTFVWKGIDGTGVIAHFNFSHTWPLPQNLADQWRWVQHKDIQDRELCAYGFGDGGGGPMNEMLEVARRVQDLEGCPRAKHTTVGEFMQGIERELKDIPKYSGELYLECHRGTLTSIAGIKRGNRKAELALRDAEFLATLASVRGNAYPAGELLTLWKRLLTSQFHDILPGSSIAEVNDEAIAEFAAIVSQAGRISDESAGALVGTGSRLLLVNSLSWDRGTMELTGVPEGSAISGATCQWVEGPSGDRRLAASGLDLPPLGGRVFGLAPAGTAEQSPFRFDGEALETPFARVSFDSAGRIISLVDKASGREIVRDGGVLNCLEAGEDIPQSWDNWDIDADQELKMRPEERLVSREVVADGPLQHRIRSKYLIGNSSGIIQDMVFHSDTPRINFETAIDWSEKHTLLKAVFDIRVHSDFARHEIQYGHVERPTHRNLPQDRARFEVACHKWVDLSDNGFGVAILNDCKYGVSVHGTRIGLTLIKSGTHPDPRGDAGRHIVTYSLLPHNSGFSVESVVRPAYELNVPVLAFAAGDRAEGLASLVTVDASNVIVESVKWAEDGGGFIVRLYEAGKSGVATTVGFGVPVRSVSECNLLEERLSDPVAFSDGRVLLSFGPFEIKTLYCEM
jgi:alpha-mannosidase